LPLLEGNECLVLARDYADLDGEQWPVEENAD
jgi:hypothetical protein